MAKRHRNQQVTASFHYLVKSRPNENNPEDPIEEGFSEEEFQRVVRLCADTDPLDLNDEMVISEIKVGHRLPFIEYEEAEPGLHFGDFEGAYYGQKFRNNRLGEITAESLNLRKFHYLLARLRDGRVVVGTSYHGNFGDFGGLQTCFSHGLRGDYRVASKALKSVQTEIGDGEPISLKLTYRKSADRIERGSIFDSAGVIAIKSSDYGEGFEDKILEVSSKIRGNDVQRRKAIADIVNQAEMIELDEDDIVGCSAVIRRKGSQSTVYFLGENNFATRFPLSVGVDSDGVADRNAVRVEMTRVLREKILPMLA